MCGGVRITRSEAGCDCALGQTDGRSLNLYPCSSGSGATSVVQVARCIPLNQKVAVKRIDLERCGSSIEEIQVG